MVRNLDKGRTHLLDVDMVHQDQRVFCRGDQLDSYGQVPTGARIALLIHQVSRQREQLPEREWQWMTIFRLPGSVAQSSPSYLLACEVEPRNRASNRPPRRLLKVLQSRYSLQANKRQVRHVRANHGQARH